VVWLGLLGWVGCCGLLMLLLLLLDIGSRGRLPLMLTLTLPWGEGVL
jgi:hypothetical protein